MTMSAFPIFRPTGNPAMYGHRAYIGYSSIVVNDNQDEALRRRSLARREGLAWDAFASDERPGSWVPSVFEELEQ